MDIDVIIPVLNEEDSVGRLIRFLRGIPTGGHCVNIIVVDGGSSDRTIAVVREQEAQCFQSPIACRSSQMNLGASMGSGKILYFLHGDTFPPDTLFKDLDQAVGEHYTAGCFRLQFDFDHWFLRFNAWFTKFRFTFFRFGDQSLFVTRNLFEEVGGFDETLKLLEGNAMVSKLKARAKFKLIQKPVVTSARKYRKHGVFKLQALYVMIYLLFHLGSSQSRLTSIYNTFISR